jgi:heme oxygenase
MLYNDEVSPKLPAEMNSATRYAELDFAASSNILLTESFRTSRSLHTHLNALITSRLPLVLPPHAISPLVYATGLIPFARVYLAFEKAWEKACVQKLLLELRQNTNGSGNGSVFGEDIWIDVPLDLLSQSQDLGESVEGDGDESRDMSEADEAASSTPSLRALPETPLDRGTLTHRQTIRLLCALRNLRPAGILRSARLRNDLAALLAISVEEVDELLEQTGDQGHNLFSPVAEAFVDHIEKVTAEKPHVLIAYAFVLYMAIFSGGRWIRSVLSSAGDSFWRQEHFKLGESIHENLEELESTSSKSNTILLAPTPATQVRLEKLGLSFWFFQSPTDGLDIKAEFKSRLDSLEPLLTEEQRADVVEEARVIFERCESLVSDLDERVGRRGIFVEVVRPDQRLSDKTDAKLLSDGQVTVQSRDAAAKRVRLMLRGWQDASVYAGWALLLGSVCWYAMHALEPSF